MKVKKVFLTIIIFFLSLTAFVYATGGWASENGGTTGGAGGTVVTVSNFANLESYAESSSKYIIQVSGTIDVGYDGFDIGPDKTLIGLGTNATLSGNVNFDNDELLYFNQKTAIQLKKRYVCAY